MAMMSAFFLSSISAVEVNLNLLAIRSSETNIFSDPLPQNGSNDFLKGVVEKPYLDRTDYGVKADADLFFIPESRTGLSFSFTYSHPVSATETYPVADDGTSFDDKEEPAKWHYEQRDALSSQHDKLSFALGPVFRFRYSAVEIGSAVRFSFSTYNFFDSFTFGVEAQPYFKAYFNSSRLMRTRFPIYKIAMIAPIAITTCNLRLIVPPLISDGSHNTCQRDLDHIVNRFLEGNG